MPKYVALPCPPQPIVAQNSLALDGIARVDREPERVEIERVPPDLLEEKRQRHAHERGYAGVANEVRYIGIPLHTWQAQVQTYISTRAGQQDKGQREKVLTYAPPHPQTQTYSAPKPNPANGPQQQDSRENSPHDAVQLPLHDWNDSREFVPRHSRIIQVTFCAQPLPAADYDKP